MYTYILKYLYTCILLYLYTYILIYFVRVYLYSYMITTTTAIATAPTKLSTNTGGNAVNPKPYVLNDMTHWR